MTSTGSSRRVVVTGVGLVTPVGVGNETAWENLCSGTSGADRITLIDTTGFSVNFGCEVKDFEPSDWMPAKETKRVDRFVHFAMAAAKLTLDDAAFDMRQETAERCGVVLGSGIGGVLSMEYQFRRFDAKGPGRISPFTIPLLMVNCAPGMIAIEHGFKGLNYAPVTACATGSHSIALAMRHILCDEADVILAGGAEAGISTLGLGGFANMKALSTRNDDPTRASRPFDKDRDGFVMAEGAGAILLEELEHAKARGARIYAELCGYGMTDDAFHITAPEETGAGATRAIRMAIDSAGISSDQIDYINAHGTSTLYNDRTETRAIKQALGETAARQVAISSTKGCTGHTLGAAGGIEAAITVLALHRGKLPPTINYETPDPDCDLDYVPNEARARDVRYALSNSLGFGGHNCSLCFGRYED